MKTKKELTLGFLKENVIIFDGRYSYSEVRDFLLKNDYKDYGWQHSNSDVIVPDVEFVEQGCDYGAEHCLFVNHKLRMMYSVNFKS